MKTIERINTIIKHSGLSISAFEKKIEASNNSIQTALKRNAATKDTTLNKILKEFPEINPTWLLTGNGAMLKSNEPTVDIVEHCQNCDETKKQLDQTNELLNQTLETLSIQNKAMEIFTQQLEDQKVLISEQQEEISKLKSS